MVGRTISHYRIEACLGEGGNGVVYQAEDLALKRTVALKFLKADPLTSDTDKRNLLREARSIAALQHPNICTIYEIVEEGEHLFIAMAFARGITLKEKLAAGPVAADEAVRIAIEIATGLKTAHEAGIVHQDIKCSNIMIDDAGRIKIMDFGVALLPDSLDDRIGMLAGGTASYMSPEQCRGDIPDRRTDIWSLGVCLYEMVSGHLPFEDSYAQAVIYSILNNPVTPVGSHGCNVTPGLESIINRCLEKDADLRYQTISELHAALEAYAQTPPQERTARPTPPRASVAVLPFADMSPQHDQEYFCDGIAEEIINALNQIEELRVAARTSSFAYKNSSATALEIGSNLGVRSLLEGSVRKAGNQLRITVTLTDVSTDRYLWSERYDRELKDIFAIQDEIAEQIVAALKVTLTRKEKALLTKPPAQDVEAYDYYLRGRRFYQHTTRRGILHALEMYQRAIEADPTYAQAYAGMSECYSFLYSFFDNDTSNLDQALELSHKALALDPDLAEAHTARGRAFFHNRQYNEAEQEFEHAIALNPQSYPAHEAYARNCYARGDFERAAEFFRRAITIDPDNFNAPLLLQQTYQGLNDHEKAAETLQIGLRNAQKHVLLHPDDARALYMYAISLALSEDTEGALQYINRALAIDSEDNMILYGAACVYAITGRHEDALDKLEESMEGGCLHKDWLEKDSDFQSLHEHPRFQALLDRLE